MLIDGLMTSCRRRGAGDDEEVEEEGEGALMRAVPDDRPYKRTKVAIQDPVDKV